jgi:hypothetical protein
MEGTHFGPLTRIPGWNVPLLADLHQIIKSGQLLTNEHVQYFLYQILRGPSHFLGHAGH